MPEKGSFPMYKKARSFLFVPNHQLDMDLSCLLKSPTLVFCEARVIGGTVSGGVVAVVAGGVFLGTAGATSSFSTHTQIHSIHSNENLISLLNRSLRSRSLASSTVALLLSGNSLIALFAF